MTHCGIEEEERFGVCFGEGGPNPFTREPAPPLTHSISFYSHVPRGTPNQFLFFFFFFFFGLI